MEAGMAHGLVASAMVAGSESRASFNRGNHQLPQLYNAVVNFSYLDNVATEDGERTLHLVMTKIMLRTAWLAMETKEAVL